MNEVELAGVTAALSVDEYLTITKTKIKKDRYPPYTLMGNGRFDKIKGCSMDIIEVCGQLNTSENALLKYLRDCVVENQMHNEDMPNVVRLVSRTDYTQYLKTAMMKNYPHMEYLDIVRRISRGLYMINPRLIIAPNKTEAQLEQWRELKPEYDNMYYGRVIEDE